MSRHTLCLVCHKKLNPPDIVHYIHNYPNFGCGRVAIQFGCDHLLNLLSHRMCQSVWHVMITSGPITMTM